MRTTLDPQVSGTAPTVSFDPFGEPLDLVARAEPCRAEPPRERKAYRVTAAAFWALALLLVGTRVYVSDVPVHQTFAAIAETAQAGFGSILR